ncbi:hypothetical protein PIB30_079624 [Stylosanthes scabra]|uniref:Uncharacterized protein n=1 Tax=Stylosanthes scabra TaxID=79078 RepID=A0ABU6QRC7_9FABA|nr:hypothetical protein [Stylosanthes scabra]
MKGDARRAGIAPHRANARSLRRGMNGSNGFFARNGDRDYKPLLRKQCRRPSEDDASEPPGASRTLTLQRTRRYFRQRIPRRSTATRMGLARVRARGHVGGG